MLQPEVFASASEPQPFGFIATFVCLGKNAEDRSMLDGRGSDCGLEDEGIVAGEEERGDDGHMRNNDPPRLVSTC